MGKSSAKHRACPAVGRDISAAECGENRASQYVCPAECSFNPWSAANLERARDIEDALRVKLEKQLSRECDSDAALRREVDQIFDQDELAAECFLFDLYHRRRDASGLTLNQRLAQRKGELKNDERFLVGHLARRRPLLLEIHEVINDRECRAIDLLAPERGSFTVVDFSIASKAVRFMQLVVAAYPMPHHHRLHGLAVQMVEFENLDAAEILRQIREHLGGGAPGATLQEWLDEHSVEVCQSVKAISVAHTRDTLQACDIKVCQTTYELTTSILEIQRRLADIDFLERTNLTSDDLADDVHVAYNWLEAPAPLPTDHHASHNPPRTLLGRIFLRAKAAVIEAHSEESHSSLRRQLEDALGPLIRFSAERIHDVAAAHLAKVPEIDASLVPPGLRAGKHARRVSLTRTEMKPDESVLTDETVASINRRQHEKWIDSPVPALDGLTPRQAAGQPEVRERLLRLVKSAVRHHDGENLRTGRADDINWLVSELGLTEILFAPPPQREPLDPPDGEDEGDDDEDYDYNELFDPPPALPPGPFSREVVLLRFASNLQFFDGRDSMIEEFIETAPEFLDAIDWNGEILSEDDYVALLFITAQIWFLFCPMGTRPHPWDAKSLEVRLRQHLRQMPPALPLEAGALNAHFRSEAQPALAGLIVKVLLGMGQASATHKKIKDQALPFIIASTLALIDDLDETLRKTSQAPL